MRDIGQFGLGARRSLEDYERLTGVDFRRKLINGRTQEQIEAELPQQARDKRVQERFREIWRNNAWGSPETRSGPGSTLAQTATLRERLGATLRELGVRSLVDAGCGELNWINTISGDLDTYLGFDVVEEIVAELRKRYEARKNHFFNTADVTRHVLPRCDVLLCRDVLTT